MWEDDNGSDFYATHDLDDYQEFETQEAWEDMIGDYPRYDAEDYDEPEDAHLEAEWEDRYESTYFEGDY